MPQPEEVWIPQSVLDAVLEFVNGFSWEDKRAAVEAYPGDLLGEYADYAFLLLIQRYEGQPERVNMLNDHRALLAECRMLGIAEAFARRQRPSRERDLTPQVLRELTALRGKVQVLQYLVPRPAVRRLVYEAIVALANARSPAGIRAVLTREQDLLLTQAAEVCARMSDDQLVVACAELIAQAREHGIEAAMAEVFGERNQSPPVDDANPEIQAILDELLYADAWMTVERKLFLARKCLALVEPHTPLWAGLQMILGRALMETYGSDRADRVEEAMACHRSVLAWAEQRGLRAAVAGEHRSLAQGYLERIRGDRGDNLKLAVVEAELAVAGVDPEEDPYAAVQAHYMAASAYMRLHGRDLRPAYEHAQSALRYLDAEAHPDALVGIQQCLGLIAHKGGPDDHGDGGITYLRESVTGVDATEDPDRWVTVNMEFARVLLERPSTTPDEMEDAFTMLHAALTLVDPERRPEQWARAHDLLALVYRWRASGDPADNIEQMIEHAEQALSVFTPDNFPDQWATTFERFADAYRLRIAGNPVHNTEVAIAHYTSLADFYAAYNQQYRWAVVQEKLGHAHLKDEINGLERFIRAQQHYQLALTEFERLGATGNITQTRGNLVVLGITRINRGAEIEDAYVASVVERAQQVVETYSQEQSPDEYVQARIMSANLQLALADRDGDATHKVAAREFLTDAIAAATPFTAVQVLEARLTLANLMMADEGPDAALAALAVIINAGEQRLAQVTTDASRERLLPLLAAAYTSAAYAELCRGRIGEALILVERGRSRILFDALGPDLDLSTLPETARLRVERAQSRVEQALIALNSPPAEGRMTDAQLGRALGVARAELAEALAAIPRGGMTGAATGTDPWRLAPNDAVLVVPLVSGHGTALFVLPPSVEQPADLNVLQLEVTLDELQGAEAQWAEAVNRLELGLSNVDELSTVMQELTRWLWDRVGGPLQDRLQALDAEELSLRVVSSELSRMIPLHAAWRMVDGQPQTLADDRVISYAPSVRLLYEAGRRAVQPVRRGDRGLLLADSRSDLHHAVDEVRAVAALLDHGEADMFIGSAATRKALFLNVSGRTHVHIACHAMVNWFQPSYSLIQVADGYVFAGELAGLSLDATRLVVLSACQSAITSFGLSGEYTGLAAAFLRAGAPGVIATLWSVDDHATSLLMRRFYEELVRNARQPADALRLAQLWLRDATVSDLSNYDPSPATIRRWKLLGLEINARPYTSPYFWAGFILVGV